MADPAVVIRPARPGDLELLPAIEVAAGQVFRDVGLNEVADDPPPTATELAAYQADGRCWVATVDRRVVGYLIAEIVDGNGHIEQVSVHPDSAGRSIGRMLIGRAEAWAVAWDFPAMTLTTFVEVPWNAPYYQRLGYRFLKADELSRGLAAIRASEVSAGLDRWPRAAMLKPLAGAHGHSRHGQDITNRPSSAPLGRE